MHNPSSRLRGQLFGEFQLTLAGSALHRPGKKLLALIALLAVRAEPIRRQELADLLWTDERSLLHLRQLLPKAREWLGGPDLLGVTPDEVWLNIETDSGEFSRLVHNDEYAAALALWPVLQDGPKQVALLADLEPETAGYADWLAAERTHLDSLREEALLALGMQLEYGGDASAALGAYRDLLRLDGLAEEAHRGIMRVALREGQVQLGLRQYELFLQKLRREFNRPVEPLPETVRIAAQLQEAAETGLTAIGTAAAPDLDAAAATFVGRHEELRQLVSILDSAAGRVVSVVAPGGAGKTQIAMQVARQWQQNTGGQVVFLELEHVPVGRSLDSALAAELSLRAGPNGEVLDGIAQRLASSPVLLVLDGAEARPADGPIITRLAAACSGESRLLATSRVSLDLHNEVAWTLPGMSYPAQATTSSASDFDAVRLFCHAARRSQPGFDPGADALQVIGRICAAVDGLPLAVVLAASLARKLSLEGILQGVQDDPLALQADDSDLDGRHRRLHNVVATTWVNLPGDDQQSLQNLSVFRAGFDTGAARRVADAGLHRLLRFVNRSLVSVRADDRFDLHPLIRSWGRNALADGNMLSEAARRHADHFLEYGAELYDLVLNARLQEYLGPATRELNNFQAALDSLENEQRWDEAVLLCMQLVPLWDLTGRRQQALDTAARFLPHARQERPAARLLSGLANINLRLGYLAEARDYSTRALQVFEVLGDPTSQAMELGNQARIARAASEFTRADELYARALNVVRGSGSDYELSVLLNNYGVLLQTTGAYERAVEVHRECLVIREQRGDVRGIMDSLMNLATCLSANRQPEDALELRLQVLGMPELQAADDVMARTVRLGLGYDYLNLQRYAEATSLLTALLEEAQVSGDRSTESYALGYLAACALHTGEADRASALYQQAAAAFGVTGNRKELVVMAEGLALIAGRSHNWPYFHRALRAAARLRLELGVEPDDGSRTELDELLVLAPPGERDNNGDLQTDLDWVFTSDPLGQKVSVSEAGAAAD